MKSVKNLTICGTKQCQRRTILLQHSRNFSSEPKPQHQVRKKWNSVVGLEIHAQIKSESKLFSGASTHFGMPINNCVSLFDCATPGTLPVLNRRCVEAGVLTALALSCQLNRVSLFDRKHYFYADSPAGYQITQQRQPLAIDGELKFNVFNPGVHKQLYVKSSKIKQIQLEQDSGKSLHDAMDGKSLVDLNRAGIPLMELVFEPDLTDGEEAAALVKELVMILQRVDTCSCKMEEGALRVDANVSVNRPGEPLGVRTEVKNIGSIRAVAGAIKYEIERQIKSKESGGSIVNETLSWDAENHKTVSMRNKEERQDYRFMPEPNLPPLHLHMDENQKNLYSLVDVLLLKSTLPELPEETRSKLQQQFGLATQAIITIVNRYSLVDVLLLKSTLPELPEETRSKLQQQFGLATQAIITIVNRYSLVDVLLLKSTLPELPEETRSKLQQQFGLATQAIITTVNEDILLRLFNNVMRENSKRNAKRVADILIMELMTVVNKADEQLEHCKITEHHIGDLVDLLESGIISIMIARKVLAALMADPEKMPTDIVNKNNWIMINDEKTLTEICQSMIERNEKIVKQYKAGKTKVIKVLLGEIARTTEQRANMAKVTKIMERLLK